MYFLILCWSSFIIRWNLLLGSFQIIHLAVKININFFLQSPYFHHPLQAPYGQWFPFCDNSSREDRFDLKSIHSAVIFSPAAECYGVSAQYSFGVFWASWGCSGKEPTGFVVPRFRVPFPGTGSGKPGCQGSGFRRLRARGFEGFGVRWVPDGSSYWGFCSRGLDGTGSGNRVPGTRGIKKVSGSGDSVPKVPQLILFFERALLYFEGILLYFERIPLYFERILLYFESILLYFEGVLFVPWKSAFVLWKYTFVLWKCTLYFESILLYFASILSSLCHANACFRLHWRSIQQGQRKGGNWFPFYKRKPPCCWGYHLRLFFKENDILSHRNRKRISQIFRFDCSLFLGLAKAYPNVSQKLKQTEVWLIAVLGMNLTQTLF